MGNCNGYVTFGLPSSDLPVVLGTFQKLQVSVTASFVVIHTYASKVPNPCLELRSQHSQHTVNMDTSLWAKLSLDLRRCILDQTDNLPTLQNWCIATRHHLSLHRSALDNCWRELKIDHRDLIAEKAKEPNQVSPERKYMEEKKIESCLKDAGQPPQEKLIQTVTTKHPSGLIAASYVRRLFMDFTFGFNPNLHFLPSAEALRRTLSTLDPFSRVLSKSMLMARLRKKYWTLSQVYLP